jgi:hypothetical protein
MAFVPVPDLANSTTIDVIRAPGGDVTAPASACVAHLRIAMHHLDQSLIAR